MGLFSSSSNDVIFRLFATSAIRSGVTLSWHFKLVKPGLLFDSGLQPSSSEKAGGGVSESRAFLAILLEAGPSLPPLQIALKPQSPCN